ncbi:MAG: type II toxin-antitoxin system VapC family toxin [Sulfuricella sp.]
MRLLLDTHIALWAITDNPKLPTRARELILAPENEIYISAASVWEIAIKHALGRHTIPISGEEARHYFAEAGYIPLPITDQHAAATETLPPLHADPFDRILVAQALTEPLKLVTHDATVAGYSDSILLV